MSHPKLLLTSLLVLVVGLTQLRKYRQKDRRRCALARLNKATLTIMIATIMTTVLVLLFPKLPYLAQASSPAPPSGCNASTVTFTNTTAVSIPTGPAVVNSSLTVSGAGPYLLDLDLTTALDHTFAADLDITLQSPSGTVVTLTTDNGAGNDNVFGNTLWDDDANPGGQVPYTTNNGLATDHAYVNLTPASPLVPEEAMGAFIGEDPNGTWILTISDDLGGDGGTLNSWSLNITTAGACVEMAVLGNGQVIADNDATPSTSDDTDFGSVALGGAITRTFTISNSGAGNLNLTGSPLVTIAGLAVLDFSLVISPTTPITPGGTTTFQVRFTPAVTGTRLVTVTIANDDPDENPYDFVIQGTGLMPTVFERTYLPIIVSGFVSAPDLMVDDIRATSTGVTVTIRNAGTAAAVDEFWVDVYFNPSQTPGLNQPWDAIASYGAVWGVTQPLAPGESLVLTTGGTYYDPGRSSPLPFPVGVPVYALVDSINYDTTYGAVQESNEGNNLGGPVISTAGGAGGAATSAPAPSPVAAGLPGR